MPEKVVPRGIYDSLAEILVKGTGGALEGGLRWPVIQRLALSERREELESAQLEEVGLARAAVLDSPQALDLLCQLYEVGAIGVNSLSKQGITPDLVVSVGILASAQLCEVDKSAIRITTSGIQYVNELIGSAE